MRGKILMAAGTVALAAGALTAFGGGTAKQRPVTSDEATRLALSRLTTYQASPASVVLTASEGGGVRVRVRGLIDYRTHHGVGDYTVTGASGPMDHGLIVWDERGLGIATGQQEADSVDAAVRQADHIPASGWSPRSYTADPLDSGLHLLIGLGADRPDNPQLLAQSGPRWLGKQSIDGRVYDEFSGPRPHPQGGAAAEAANEASPLTYWIDRDGNLRRVTMRLPGLGTPTVAEIVGRRSGARVPTTPWSVP